MRRTRRSVCTSDRTTLALLLLLAATSFGEAQKLRSQKLADFTVDNLETFDFRASQRTGSSLLRRVPEARRWVEEAVEQALAARGIERSIGGEPDFYVVLWAESREKSRKLASSQVSIGYVEQFLEGELSLEFVRAGEEGPFWQGTATDRVGFTRDGPKITWEKAEKKVRKATQGLIRRFFR